MLSIRQGFFAVSLALLPACGGGGGSPTGPTTPPPQPTPTPTPAGNPPALKLIVDRTSGLSPLKVGFDACGSTDANGQKNLTFSVSYEGEPLQSLGTNCGFSHNYRSSGVTAFETRVCATDPAGAQACKAVEIKAYAPITLSVKPAGGCAGTIEATASVGAGVRAFGAIDRMLFEARSATGQRATKEGSKGGNNQWSTGVWSTGFTTRVDVTATAFSGNVPGAVADSARPGCS